MRFLRMFTNSLLAGALGAAYLTVLVLQLNPHVPLVSGTTWRWFLTLCAFYGLHLAVAFYVLLVVREFFSIDGMSPGWASVRVLAWLSAAGAAVAATLMWSNASGFRTVLGDVGARRMLAGAVATAAAAVVLLAIAVVHYSTGRRGSRVGGTLFALAVVSSVALPLAARGAAAPIVAPTALSSPHATDVDTAARVIMLLLDGASLEYVRTRSAEGRLPNFSKLLGSGASMYLATIRPTQPAPVWAAVATGMYPSKNGVRSASLYFARGDSRPLYVLPDHCFSHALVRFGAIRSQPNSASAWAARPLWSILHGAGVRTGVVRWPLTHPAPATLGFVLTDQVHGRLAPVVQIEDGAVHPPEALAAVRGSFDEPTDGSGPQQDPDEGRETVAERRDRQYVEASRTLQKMWQTQVVTLRLEALDLAGHQYFDGGQSSVFRDENEPARRRSAQQLERAYAAVDAQIGTAIDGLAPGDLLLVVSGFGMQRLNAAKELLGRVLRDPAQRGTHERAPDGFLLAYGSRVRPGRLPRGSVVDVTPTVLYFLGLPIGRDMDGFARTDLFSDEFTVERPIAFIATHGG